LAPALSGGRGDASLMLRGARDDQSRSASMSALERIPDLSQTSRHVRKVPKAEVAPSKVAKTKSRPKAALNSNLMILDQAAINAGLFF
jgi:hypothetical protein